MQEAQVAAEKAKAEAQAAQESARLAHQRADAAETLARRLELNAGRPEYSLPLATRTSAIEGDLAVLREKKVRRGRLADQCMRTGLGGKHSAYKHLQVNAQMSVDPLIDLAAYLVETKVDATAAAARPLAVVPTAETADTSAAACATVATEHQRSASSASAAAEDRPSAHEAGARDSPTPSDAGIRAVETCADPETSLIDATESEQTEPVIDAPTPTTGCRRPMPCAELTLSKSRVSPPQPVTVQVAACGTRPNAAPPERQAGEIRRRLKTDLRVDGGQQREARQAPPSVALVQAVPATMDASEPSTPAIDALDPAVLQGLSLVCASLHKLEQLMARNQQRRARKAGTAISSAHVKAVHSADKSGANARQLRCVPTPESSFKASY